MTSFFRRFYLVLGLALVATPLLGQTILQHYNPTGPALVRGDQLNLLVDAVNNLNGNGTAGAVAGTTGTFSGRLSVAGHVNTGAVPPVLTSCGTGSPAITGSDTAGIVTLGSSATGCVITFATAYTGTPYCVVSWIATPLASQSYVTSNAAITLTQTSTSGNKVQYICAGPSGG